MRANYYTKYFECIVSFNYVFAKYPVAIVC